MFQSGAPAGGYCAATCNRCPSGASPALGVSPSPAVSAATPGSPAPGTTAAPLLPGSSLPPPTSASPMPSATPGAGAAGGTSPSTGTSSPAGSPAASPSPQAAPASPVGCPDVLPPGSSYTCAQQVRRCLNFAKHNGLGCISPELLQSRSCLLCTWLAGCCRRRLDSVEHHSCFRVGPQLEATVLPPATGAHQEHHLPLASAHHQLCQLPCCNHLRRASHQHPCLQAPACLCRMQLARALDLSCQQRAQLVVPVLPLAQAPLL